MPKLSMQRVPEGDREGGTHTYEGTRGLWWRRGGACDRGDTSCKRPEVPASPSPPASAPPPSPRTRPSSAKLLAHGPSSRRLPCMQPLCSAVAFNRWRHATFDRGITWRRAGRRRRSDCQGRERWDFDGRGGREEG